MQIINKKLCEYIKIIFSHMFLDIYGIFYISSYNVLLYNKNGQLYIKKFDVVVMFSWSNDPANF